jgi:hypothetical protein
VHRGHTSSEPNARSGYARLGRSDQLDLDFTSTFSPRGARCRRVQCDIGEQTGEMSGER